MGAYGAVDYFIPDSYYLPTSCSRIYCLCVKLTNILPTHREKVLLMYCVIVRYRRAKISLRALQSTLKLKFYGGLNTSGHICGVRFGKLKSQPNAERTRYQ